MGETFTVNELGRSAHTHETAGRRSKLSAPHAAPRGDEVDLAPRRSEPGHVAAELAAASRVEVGDVIDTPDMSSECVGGLRNPARTVHNSAILRNTGRRVRKVLEKFFEDYPEARRITKLVGSSDGKDPPASLVDEARRRVALELGAVHGSPPQPDTATVSVDGHRGRLRPGLIGAFVREARDPDQEASFPEYFDRLDRPVCSEQVSFHCSDEGIPEK